MSKIVCVGRHSKTVLIVLIFAATLSLANDVRALPKWVKRTVNVVVNPPRPPIVDRGIGNAAKAARISPEAAQQAANLVTNPVPTTSGLAVKTIQATARNTVSQIQATTDFAHAVAAGNVSKIGVALARFQNAEFENELNPSVVYSIELATSLIPTAHYNSYMQVPKLIFVQPDNPIDLKPGLPVVYVNGIDTSQKEAIEEARLLANHLERNVNLLYNKTHGFKADCLWAVYDRAWV